MHKRHPEPYFLKTGLLKMFAVSNKKSKAHKKRTTIILIKVVDLKGF
jgi:hypothetical protein